MVTRVIASTCKECSVRCGSLIHVDGDKVVKITGNPAHPGSQGAFCVKGVKAPIVAREHPDRPLHPVRRVGARGEGKWEAISWDQAFGEIAERIGKVKAQYGGPSIAGAVSNHFVSRGVAMAQLPRAIGSPNYMINQDLCQGCRYTAAMLTGVSAQAANEIAKARCILVIGKSPSDSSVVQWMHIKAAKKAGATLIVVDPRKTQIARRAKHWLAPKPGTDAALALAMIDVIFEEHLYDREFVEQYCTGTEELRERARQYEPAVAEQITGIPAKDIRTAARAFATTKPACMVLGHGIDAQANGVKTAMAFHALLALTGNIDRPGTNRPAKTAAGFRDYFSIINDDKFRLPRAIESRIIGGDVYPLWSGPNSWSKSSHNPSLIEAMHTGRPYPVKALYVSGVNIVCTYPDIRNTIAALLQRAVPARGEAKTDIEIAVGMRDALKKHGLPGFDVFPWNSHRDLIDFQLEGTGIAFDDLCEKGFQNIPFEYEDYRRKGFRTPSRKIEFSSTRLSDIGQDPLPEYKAPVYAQPAGEFNLVLLTGIRSMAYHHSRFRNHAWARKMQDAPELRINPRTAERLNVGEGDWVWVQTREDGGRTLLKAWVSEEMPEDVVATGMGWWFPEMAGSDRGALTFNIDAAIPYGPPWDPISGSPEARNTACKVVRAKPGEI
ncbi:MAG: molybdopterin-dependent oxidoreductase [Betaproteobacteria bacterium]|nr:molybdopterin-dependent oxidoreductase [Betaproteobacteria bacterium]